ncbi:MAG: hypothetical protein COB42_05650 [Sulfurimonas sp.]|nr:MAG: hypothetical protein COB42_05650 [Sulfurimonas sp.]
MPSNFTELDKLTTFVALCVAVGVAIASFFRRDTKNLTLGKKILIFMKDMCINIGVTMLFYIGLIGYGTADLLAVAISGFAGHQGVRSVYLVELLIAEKLGAKWTFAEITKSKKK